MLGYTALGAGAVGLPMGLCLTLLSTRIGAAAGRLGARRFLVGGPLLMAERPAVVHAPAGGLRAVAGVAVGPGQPDPTGRRPRRRPAVHPAVRRRASRASSRPLTNTLMGSIPGRFSGLGSAINNAIARVGQPLLGAVIFIAISATFYSSLGVARAGARRRVGAGALGSSHRSTRPRERRRRTR